MGGLKEKLKEVLISTLPVCVLVAILGYTVAPIGGDLMIRFFIGSFLLIAGLALFLFGTELGMQPMGERIGAALTGSRSLWLISGFGFLLGLLVTMAEPDLLVLGDEMQKVSGGLVSATILVATVSVGVGFFLVVGLLRIVFQIKISTILIITYAVIFALAAFTGNDFLGIAFDSGGVTTGPMTVPFILALGVGVSAVRGGKSAAADSFGLVALSSAGPILSVLVMGVIYRNTDLGTPPDPEVVTGIITPFLHGILPELRKVFIAMLPIIAIFILFQLKFLKMPRSSFRLVLLGIVYTILGLTLFLLGVDVGFMPAGRALGSVIGELPYNWILVPIGLILGAAVILAEPAVRVLNDEVEHVTGGYISKRVMLFTLCAGVAIGVGLAMLRILLHFSLWWYIIPGYAISLVLTKLVPPLFCGLAFDSGGVASGPMTATFILALASGAVEKISGSANIMTEAFGMVTMVALAPLISIQILGLIYDRKTRKKANTDGDS